MLRVLSVNRNRNNINGIFSINSQKLFFKLLDKENFTRELAGYEFMKKYYPVANLLLAKKLSKEGLLLFEYENTIEENKGLLVDLFASKDSVDHEFTRVLELYRDVFLATVRMDLGRSSDVLFRDRAKPGSRLDRFCPGALVNDIDGLRLKLNGRSTSIELADKIRAVKGYFSKQEKIWCIASQCDPIDRNIGTKPIIFDYLAGGFNPIMAEFSVLFWQNFAQGNYLSLKYNRDCFVGHERILSRIDSVSLTGSDITHEISLLRRDFICSYIEIVLKPVFQKIGGYDSWYQDFKNFLAMRILSSFDVSAMEKKDAYLSLAYLELFYSLSLKKLDDLEQIVTEV